MSTAGEPMACRIGCGACCIVLRIDEPYAQHPNGKPAMERCRNLTDANECSIYDTRPGSCRAFTPARVLCGDDREEAMRLLTVLDSVLRSDIRSPMLDAARGVALR